MNPREAWEHLLAATARRITAAKSGDRGAIITAESEENAARDDFNEALFLANRGEHR